MAATSKHYGDIYRWIEKVIDSCTSPFQEMVARKLIAQFRNNLRRGGEVDLDIIHQMENILRYRLDEKTYSRIEKN
jgi:hypothetical protein